MQSGLNPSAKHYRDSDVREKGSQRVKGEKHPMHRKSHFVTIAKISASSAGENNYQYDVESPCD